MRSAAAAAAATTTTTTTAAAALAAAAAAALAAAALAAAVSAAAAERPRCADGHSLPLSRRRRRPRHRPGRLLRLQAARHAESPAAEGTTQATAAETANICRVPEGECRAAAEASRDTSARSRTSADARLRLAP